MTSTARTAPIDGRSLRLHGDSLVRVGDADHAVNVVAEGQPEWLRVALHAALDDKTTHYPDDLEAREAIATLHGRDAAEIVTTNGAAEALWLLPAALEPALAVCIHPAFTETEAALRAHNVPVERVLRDPNRNFALNVEAIPSDADLIVVGNPASPDGTLEAADVLLAMRKPGRTIVVDEAFMTLVADETCSLIREPLNDVIVIRSLTKVLAIPGLRAGYAVAAPQLAERLRAVRPPWSANALALVALTEAARRPEALAATAARAQSERLDLVRRLVAVDGIRVWPGTANFCLIEVGDGPAVLRELAARAFAVRPAASFPGLSDHHIRLTARTPEENECLVRAIGEAVDACT